MSRRGSNPARFNRFLISIHHPAQVHFYRNIVDGLIERGHEVCVCVRDKEMTTTLLDAFDIDYKLLASPRETTVGRALVQTLYEWRLLRTARQFMPDVMTSIGGIEISHVGPLVGARCLAFDDTGSQTARLLTAPSLDVVCTPVSFDRPVSGEQHRYRGFHELAYLHPNQFEPEPAILRQHGVVPSEAFTVVRFAAFDAHHDVGEHGLSRTAKQQLIERLDRYGDLYISSERPLPAEFDEYRNPVPEEHIHHLLAFADLYVGDSGTMATEAAILGTPTVRVCSVAENELSNFVELESEYGLLHSYADEEAALKAVDELLTREDVGKRWQKRRQQLLADKVDVTRYAIEKLELLAGRTSNDERATRRESPAQTSYP